MPFIGQCQLVLEVGKTVVDRCSGEHQYLGFDPLLHHLAHQLLVARLFIFVGIVVSEVVRLINHHQIIVAPVDTIERNTERVSRGA